MFVVRAEMASEMKNPYLPIMQVYSLCQWYVLRNEIWIQIDRSRMWEIGRSERLLGLPCRLTHGAYLEGWYSVPNKITKS